MTDEPFGRQRQPVRLDFSGDLRDVDHYMKLVERCFTHNYDNVERMGNQLMIYPRAVNE
jgi:hypothetical protein